MTLWESLKWLLSPAESLPGRSFSLGDRGGQPEVEDRAPVLLADVRNRTEGVLTHIESLLAAAPEGKEAMAKAGDLSEVLDENVVRLKALFRMPPNRDLILREFQIGTQPPTRAVACFMEGLSDKNIQNQYILQPLMLLSHIANDTQQAVDMVAKRLLPGNQVSERYSMADVAQSLLSGDTVLFLHDNRIALTIETKGFPSRSVSEPKTEQVIQGPHDSFVEAFRFNVALIRRRLKDPRLVTDILTVGRISNTFVGVLYIDGIVTPKLVAEVKRRIEAVDVDVVACAGVLEQYIEDSPVSLFPGLLSTERPDRVAAYLSEGHVAIIVDNSPLALICPITFWALLQTSEDYYLRAPFGGLVRYIRLTALLIALALPAFYIAVVNYHQEMLPTQLMFFVASSREHVPMPALVELLLMDLTFELIREAGIRIPSVIGPSIGLVASLILGQAAVEAKIVSPLIILIIAIAGLSSFAIPTYLTGYGVRYLRFLLLAAAATMGFFGFAAGLFVLVVYMAGMRSFGIPYLSPMAPRKGKVMDALFRPALFAMEERPAYTRPLDLRRQSPIVRPWDPNSGTKRGGS